MVDVEDRFHCCVDFKIVAFEVAGHPDIAIFIPSERRVSFAAAALRLKGALYAISFLHIFSIEEPIFPQIAAGDKGGQFIFGEIFSFDGAAPPFFPPVFDSSIRREIAP